MYSVLAIEKDGTKRVFTKATDAAKYYKIYPWGELLRCLETGCPKRGVHFKRIET